jgi:dolichol-phosphate mannosyltransferase
MANQPEVSVILPTYNEAGNAVPLIADLHAALAGISHEIIVVDDNSPDGTSAAVATAAAARHWPFVRVITRTSDRGLTKSIRTGIAEAHGAIVCWMDCDFSHPPDVLPRLVAAVRTGGADAAVASRFMPGGSQKAASAADPAIASLLSTLLNRTLSLAAGFAFTDFTSGFIAVRRDLIRAVPPRGDYGEYFVDLVVRLKRHGAVITEFPFISAPRRSGQSKTAPDTRTLLRHGWLYLTQAASILSGRFTGKDTA